MPANRYTQILEAIFAAHYQPGERTVAFERGEIESTAAALGIALPKNLGDLIYTFRYRVALPDTIRAMAPPGEQWIIRPAGRSRYQFVLAKEWSVVPNAALSKIKVPDSTPGLVAKYALSDEQALLARLRCNRLVDVFLGLVCHSLQNHLRTSVQGMGQVETDELYVGLDRRGAHYVVPVQAKGGRDRMSVVQIEQDLAMCAEKFPGLICRPVGAQFAGDATIALFEFEASDAGVSVRNERHYLLVPPEDVSNEDLARYRMPESAE